MLLSVGLSDSGLNVAQLYSIPAAMLLPLNQMIGENA
jgi:hypothetical protein